MVVSTKHDGIKYSLRPHGFRSRLLILLAAFVVSFGGALLAATPAGATGETPSSSDRTSAPPITPPATPSPTPTPSPSPSPVVAAPTVTVTVTATVTVTETVSIYVFSKSSSETQKPLSAIPSPSPTFTATTKPSQTAAAKPIPSPSQVVPVSSDSGNPLLPWGIGVVVMTGTGLATVGVTGIMRRRRYEGSHHVSNDETQLIPEYGVSDYDPNLGGHSGGSFDEELDQTRMDLLAVSDDHPPKTIPPVV